MNLQEILFGGAGMKKYAWIGVLLSVCALLCACTEAKPAETTTAVITTVVPVETASAETTAATTATAPVETTAAVTSAAPAVEDPGVEYAVLHDADGHETGVLFTYPDGSTYRWDCPIESPLPLFVRIEGKKSEREACVIEYYAGDGEWSFDWLDLVDRKLLYRHINAEDREFVFCYSEDLDLFSTNYRGTSREKYSFHIQTGVLHVVIDQKTGTPEITYELSVPNNDSGIYQNHCIPIKEVINADTGEKMENNSPYTHLYSVAGSFWYLKDGDTFYEDIRYIDGEWRDRSEAEPRPRLTGFATLYYFEDGMPEPEGEGFYSDDNASGYAVWLGYEHELQDQDPYISGVDWVKIDAHYAVQIVAYMYDGDYSTYDGVNSHHFIEHLFYYNASESYTSAAVTPLTQQASALTEQWIRYVLNKDWLEDGYTCTKTDIFRFAVSLCMCRENAGHPYADIVTEDAARQAYWIGLADAQQAVSELFGIESRTAGSYLAEAYDSAEQCYRVPMGIGLWVSPFAYEDMTAYAEGDLVHVQCTLVNSGAFEYTETEYGRYDFVFRSVQVGDAVRLQFVKLQKM